MPTSPAQFGPARDPLIDALVADLSAVRPRRWRHEAALVLALVGAELLVFAAMFGERPDLDQAMAGPAFWWKSASLAVVGVLATIAALVSLDPAVTTPRRMDGYWRVLAAGVPVALALGWVIDAGGAGRPPLAERLEWRDGVDCLVNVTLLSLPILMALGLLLRRGASGQPGRSSMAAGFAAAGIAGFIFAWHCNHDDPFYVAVWYGGAILGIAALARGVLPRLTRW